MDIVYLNSATLSSFVWSLVDRWLRSSNAPVDSIFPPKAIIGLTVLQYYMYTLHLVLCKVNKAQS